MSNKENIEVSEVEEYIQQAQVLIGVGKFEEAIGYLDRALKKEPMNKTAYMSKGIAKANLDLYEEANDCFSKASMIDKEDPEVFMHLGNISFILEKFEDGLKNYNRAISLGYDKPDLFYHLGVQYEERNELQLAIRNYTKAAHIDSLNPIYRERIATIQILLRQFDDALETLDELLKVAPDYFEAYHLSAATYTMLGDYDKAEEVLAFAEKLFPEDKEIIYDRIRVLVTKGDLDLALEKLKVLSEKEVDPIEKKAINLNFGKIVGQKENSIDSAIKYFIEALKGVEEESIDTEARYLLMNAYFMQNNYQKVFEQAENLEKIQGESVYGMCGKYYKAYASSKLGMEDVEKVYRDAIRYYRNLSVENPSRVDAYLFRAMCHKDLKEYDKAIEMVDYVGIIQPENGNIHLIKGNILNEMGKTKEAKKEYDLAKSLPGTVIPGIVED